MNALLNRLQPEKRQVLKAAASVARITSTEAFLVGGPVRDLRLGLSVSDLDIAVHGSPEAFATELNQALQGTLQSYPRFLTWKILLEGSEPIDVTTCRRETYQNPGALPIVEPASPEEDLKRRDFSVNAMAISLTTGAVHDPTQGLADLDRGVLRILHPGSFIDDPTRMLRGLRFAERLGFRFHEETERQLQQALDQSALDTVSRERLWREIFLAVDELYPAMTLKKIVESGATTNLMELDHVSDRMNRLLLGVQKAIASGRIFDRPVAFMAILLSGCAAPENVLRGAGFADKRIKSVLDLIRLTEPLVGTLATLETDRQRFRALTSSTEEQLVLLEAEDSRLESLLERYRMFLHTDLGIRGDELGVTGGPHIARALEATREAVFWGDVPANEAREYASRLARSYLKA